MGLDGNDVTHFLSEDMWLVEKYLIKFKGAVIPCAAAPCKNAFGFVSMVASGEISCVIHTCLDISWQICSLSKCLPAHIFCFTRVDNVIVNA